MLPLCFERLWLLEGTDVHANDPKGLLPRWPAAGQPQDRSVCGL